jgi:hypothetical protein
MEQPVIAATAAAQNPKNHTNFQHLAHLRPANRQTRPLFSSLLEPGLAGLRIDLKKFLKLPRGW